MLPIGDFTAYREALLDEARRYVHALPPGRLAEFDRQVEAARARCTDGGVRPWTQEAERGALVVLATMKAWAFDRRDKDLLLFAVAGERVILALREPL